MAPTPFQRERHMIFLEKINVQIEAHLEDPSFSVKKLTRDIGMSRTDLHRKLKRAAGMSTTQYIRYFRLKRAAHLLLEEPSLNIAQIAQQVGFNSGCYFTKRFRELYKIPPYEYRQQSAIRSATVIPPFL